MRLRTFVFTAGLLLMASCAFAQTMDLEQNRVEMTDLAGPWRFHTGDDPAWASPAFDDSGWSLLLAGKPWSQQGYTKYSGVAWYRLRVILPAHPGPLAFYLPGVDLSAQVFANGRLIGQFGGMPPNPEVVIGSNLLYRIPDDAISSGQPLVLAVRIWFWPKAVGFGGGLSSVPRIGEPRAIAEWRQLQVDNAFHSSTFVEIYANILTSLAGFGFFLLRRKERPYLWWGISQFFWACFSVLLFSLNFQPVPYLRYYCLFACFFTLAYFFQIEFYVTFLRQRHDWLFRGATLFLLLHACMIILGTANPQERTLGTLSAFTSAFSEACVLGMLWRGARRRTFGAAVLLVPYCTAFMVAAMGALIRLPFLSVTAWADWARRFLNETIAWPVPVSANTLTGDFEMFAVLVILALGYARSRGDEERLESELEAARTVQNVLIADDVPSVLGFQLQAVYRPASQVGGDFFQVSATEKGGALIVIGDVSGKGMPAAMTVSLLVGTFRTLAHYTQSPGEILAAMNQRMMARSSGGFTTCLVLRCDADGKLTVANAGHVAPYVAGKELLLENGLPLGLAANSSYAECSFQLAPGQQLTLLTDGVVEARDQAGTLLGFDRSAALSTQPAEAIASAAQAFGQDDDITVLTLSYAAIPAAA
ncbi:MAG: SpoIIE family protein phosphatase [Terracidiphilus sp.]